MGVTDVRRIVLRTVTNSPDTTRAYRLRTGTPRALTRISHFAALRPAENQLDAAKP
ncbi:hypothetical protein KCMC57_up47710 [Kitasatospora sp. CMC57]|uniref:Uncharacterized protein n=1 Tax=Kitasatospora sp. CMC57 TaxID=3231513 RepID=A0AB33K0N1_9ACTN